MPKISLVAVVYKEKELLARLLENSGDCFDELVVVHDGPEAGPGSLPSDESVRIPSHVHPEMAVDFSKGDQAAEAARLWIEKKGVPARGSIHELVARYGGRFFEGPRCYTHEPHWPFTWSACSNDWILLWDADEFPHEDMRAWLADFRRSSLPDENAPGYTCIWPLWDGKKALSMQWPPGRLFLIDRSRVRYFGMGENRPSGDTPFAGLDLVLHHQPRRKSFGIKNIVFRKIAYRWRRAIALSLLGSPLNLARWRWEDREWPAHWESFRQGPLKQALRRLVRFPLAQAKSMFVAGQRPNLSAMLNPGLHHFLLGLAVARAQWQKKAGTEHHG